MAASLTNPAKSHNEQSTEKNPIMIEVPPARIPVESDAVIPHADICEGATGIRLLYLKLQKYL